MLDQEREDSSELLLGLFLLGLESDGSVVAHA